MTRRSAAWPAFWLAVACAFAKLVHWSAPALTLDALRTYLLDVAVSAHQDVAFAAGLGLVGALLLRLTAAGRRAPARGGWW
jgi:hypothetical protein